jgi:hypothetical protein
VAIFWTTTTTPRPITLTLVHAHGVITLPPLPTHTQVLLVTSYMRASVELRGMDGGNFTAEGEMNATITGLSPATQYSLTLTFIFTGGLAGPSTPGQIVTTLDDSKSYNRHMTDPMTAECPIVHVCVS